MAPLSQAEFKRKAAKVRLLALDVDGVLTDGSLIYASAGDQIQIFHVHDGLGLKLLMQAEIQVALISARSSAPLARRALELKIVHVFQGVRDKVEVYEDLKKKLGLKDRHTAYMGDDLVDLPLLKRAGLSLAVANAVQPVKEEADYVTTLPGGRGAVREVCEKILVAQGKWEPLFTQYFI